MLVVNTSFNNIVSSALSHATIKSVQIMANMNTTRERMRAGKGAQRVGGGRNGAGLQHAYIWYIYSQSQPRVRKFFSSVIKITNYSEYFCWYEATSTTT